eukprot:5576382-Alexandrium_andersonii.AAC.1
MVYARVADPLALRTERSVSQFCPKLSPRLRLLAASPGVKRPPGLSPTGAPGTTGLTRGRPPPGPPPDWRLWRAGGTSQGVRGGSPLGEAARAG